MVPACIIVFLLAFVGCSRAYLANSRFVSRVNVIKSCPLVSRLHAVEDDANGRATESTEAAEAEAAEAEAERKLIERISAEVMAESGVELDQLINPSKVVNLERDLISLTERLQSASTSEEKSEIEAQMAKKRKVLFVEKRAVMRGWLKNLFVGQSVVAIAISYAMVHNSLPNMDLPLSVQVLGFWMWWLFIIPSLRARKPVAAEKEALNIAFLASPVVSLALPAATKDVAFIWWANAATVLACYIYTFVLKGESAAEEAPEAASEENKSLPDWLVKAYKALDYGSGQERGLRK